MSLEDWTLQLKFTNSPDPLRLRFDNEIILGRRVTADREYSGADLTVYEAAELGVSRRHARVHFENGHLFITDLGSGNGTILNGTRLAADTATLLNDGDELYLGHLQSIVHLNKTQFQNSTILDSKVELNLENAPKVSRGQRVLIVEDDMRLSRLYQLALEKAGFSVQTCRDVVSAIRIIGQSNPVLIVLDLMLPAVHGLELCRYVRRDPEIPFIPVMVVSAVTDALTVKEAMDVGVNVFLAKPPNIKELTAVASALIFQSERENPGMGTKKLAGTASLNHIEAAPRKDTLILFVEGSRDPIGLVVETQITLGRQRQANARDPHVDLDQCGAFDKGVSRTHAIIRRRNKGFIIEDLGSSNGTFVNGYSLKEHESVAIANGDELRLGKLRMHVYLLAESDLEHAES